jgi:preprotein translocase subunit SecE
MSNQRFIMLVFLAAAVVVGVTLRSVIMELLPVLGLPDLTLFHVISVSTASASVLAIIALFVLLRRREAVSFVDEVITELRRVTWPGREETVNNTTVVIGVVAVLSSVLAFYDFLWAKVTGLLLFS